MKKSLFLVGTVLVSALVASATDLDKYEAFAGYSFVKFNPNSNCSATACGSFFPNFNANGGDGQFVYNTEKGIGVALDIGAVTKGTLNHINVDATVLNFVAGPRYTFRRHDSRFRPFVQALFGGAYSTASTQVSILGGEIVTPLPSIVVSSLPITTRLVASRTGFAMLAGGGLDIKINKHITFRPIGADYYLLRMPDFLTQNIPGHNDHNANNFRYTAGVNFLFGQEK